jgi:hypothetical protein
LFSTAHHAKPTVARVFKRIFAMSRFMQAINA